jgi:hypothetical protein
LTETDFDFLAITAADFQFRAAARRDQKVSVGTRTGLSDSAPELLREMDARIFSLRDRRRNRALYDDFDGLKSAT